MLREYVKGKKIYILFDTYHGMGFYYCKALTLSMYKRYQEKMALYKYLIIINYYIIKEC